MNKKNGIFLALLIVSIITTIIVMVFVSKNEVDEYNQMQETIATNEEEVQEMNETVQQLDQQNEAVYDNLEEQLGQ